MSEKHTPGPWFYDRGVIPPDGPGRYSTISGDNDTTIAEVNDLIPAGIANANLIAAAPDHHAVALELRRLMLVIESAVRHGDPKNHAAVTALLISNVDAIEKATGVKP